MQTAPVDRATVSLTVKKTLIAESRLSLAPEDVDDREPINGEVLRVSSLGFLGMLLRIEDELGVTLPDDLFTGRTFHVVDDIIEVVLQGAS
jgi:acyl carrier protein